MAVDQFIGLNDAGIEGGAVEQIPPDSTGSVAPDKLVADAGRLKLQALSQV
jgi:hypothetical protein